jgi:serine/threonine-protein phosphatase Stp1
MAAGRFMSRSATHTGTVRDHNEDALLDRPDLGLWAVADGAGGHARGDVAARMVVEALEAIPSNLAAAEMLAEVRQRISEAHANLRAVHGGEPDDISATTVVVLIARGEHYACLWAGDSRGYLLRDGLFEQITRDHSVVQELLDAGTITPEQADGHPSANVITRAVGAQNEVELEKVTSRLRPGDRVLLCSDGLCKAVPDAELARLLAGSPEVDRLIEAALAHAGRDNVTAVSIEVLDPNSEQADDTIRAPTP